MYVTQTVYEIDWIKVELFRIIKDTENVRLCEGNGEVQKEKNHTLKFNIWAFIFLSFVDFWLKTENFCLIIIINFLFFGDSVIKMESNISLVEGIHWHHTLHLHWNSNCVIFPSPDGCGKLAYIMHEAAYFSEALTIESPAHRSIAYVYKKDGYSRMYRKSNFFVFSFISYLWEIYRLRLSRSTKLDNYKS